MDKILGNTGGFKGWHPPNLDINVLSAIHSELKWLQGPYIP